MDPDTKQLSDGSLFGGSPARVLRLTSAGERALAELRAGPVRSAQAAVLARRLTDAGLAHPVPPTAGPQAGPAALSVTVIIPVRDRAAMLDRCLAALGGEYPVVVVDDGSADPRRVAAVVARHGARLYRRESSGGPAAARNAGLAAVGTELVAFLDSDCVPPGGWIDALAAHLADPLVGAAAPRVVTPSPAARPAAAARYAAACGSLDLGGRPARVAPGSRVSYVPTAALLVRRAALGGPQASREVFDPALRYGEDVDLIWRLHNAGWRIRYEPAVRVPHESPPGWLGLLAKRFCYGTSAAPLARRHPANMAPLVLQPWPAGATAALLARRPLLALAAAAGGWLDLTSLLRRARHPSRRRAGGDRHRRHPDVAGRRPVRNPVRGAPARRGADGARRPDGQAALGPPHRGGVAARRPSPYRVPPAPAGPGPGPVHPRAHRRRCVLRRRRLGGLRSGADAAAGPARDLLAAASRRPAVR